MDPTRLATTNPYDGGWVEYESFTPFPNSDPVLDWIAFLQVVINYFRP